jgi:hypothetical protein
MLSFSILHKAKPVSYNHRVLAQGSLIVVLLINPNYKFRVTFEKGWYPLPSITSATFEYYAIMCLGWEYVWLWYHQKEMLSKEGCSRQNRWWSIEDRNPGARSKRQVLRGWRLIEHSIERGRKIYLQRLVMWPADHVPSCDCTYNMENCLCSRQAHLFTPRPAFLSIVPPTR